MFITGLGAAGTVVVAGGSYSIGCTGTFTTVTGSINNGQTVCVRHTTALALSTTTNTTLTIGTTSDTFSSTTAATLDPLLDADNDGIPNGVEASVSRNPLVKDNDVFGNAQLFVMQQFRDFLGREGEVSGLNYWVSFLATGGTREQVTAGFIGSSEFYNAYAPVARLYFADFLRIPDYAGLTYWAGQLRTGTSLAAISEAFAASPEFVSRYGGLDNTQFVTQVYQNVLGRAPDPAGLAYWAGQLNGGTLTRGQLMVGFSESAEYGASIANEVYVTMVYAGMLRRAPLPGGFSFWVSYLDAGNSQLSLIASIIATSEYHSRFLP